ncbi:AI-2E family transporter [Entomobacter blattae]|uniref:Transport protein YdiK n=1 Tax=Entomobacter blattae TaxID=2762277 RepID=A0A7H1NSU1_9PROT|nr:AI-2E family transporter [Entomobacter blattae]QNT78851.1 Putative transport protein YdiK [Entomobacter blattae]
MSSHENNVTVSSLKTIDYYQKQQNARIILTLILLVFGIFTIKNFIPALVWGGIFAIACWPLYKKVKQKWPFYNHYNMLFPFLFTTAVAMIFMLPLTWIIVQFVNETKSISTWLTHVQQTGVPIPSWMEKIPVGKNALEHWWTKNLTDPEDLAYFIHNIQEWIVAFTTKIGSQVAHRGILFFFSITTLFFLFRDGDTLIRQSIIASRKLFGRQGEAIAQQMIITVHGTVSGMVFVGLGEGIVLGALYAISGTPHPALLGILTALGGMIPFCSYIVIVLVSVLTLLNSSFLIALIVFLLSVVIVFAADHFIRPTLIGGNTKLHFLWVLLGILGGIETWGFLGLFLGPAIMAALDLMWKNWVKEKKIHKS